MLKYYKDKQRIKAGIMKKLKKFFKTSTFYKILFSYIFLLMIPTFIFYWFYDREIVPLFEQTIQENDLQSLMILQESYDSYFLQIERIAQQIEQQEDFTIKPEILDVQSSLDALSELMDYVAVTPFLNEIVLYLHGDSYVYTSQTTAPLNSFFKSNFLHLSNTQDEMIELFKNPLLTQVILKDTVSIFSKDFNSIILIQEIHPYTLPDSVTIAFYLDANGIQSLSNSEDLEKNYFVYNDNGMLVTHKSNDELYEHLNSSSLLTIQQEIKDNAFELNGETYIVCDVISQETGMHYVSYTPVNKLYLTLNTLQQNILIIAFIGVVISALAITYFMNSNYKPLKKLRQEILEIFPTKNLNVDDIEQISHGIHLLYEEYKEHQEQTKNLKSTAFLLDLLHGTADEYSEDLSEFNIKFKNKDFFVICVILKGDVRNLAEIINLDKHFNKIVDGYMIMGIHHSKHFFIANPKAEQNTLHLLNEIYDEISKFTPNLNITLAAGKRYSNRSDISASYYGAITAADYSFVMGKNRVILEENLQVDNSLSFGFPQTIFEKLENALSQGKTELFYPALDELVEYLKQPGLPLYHVRSVAYKALNTCIHVMQNCGDKNFSKTLSNEYSTALSEFETLDELISAVQNIGLNISYYIVKNLLKSETSLVERMKQYIKDNYYDASFSVQTIADDFEMSQVNISRYFKKSTGYTIIEYLTEVRMSKAKELLKENQLTLDEIVEKVGYLNTSSFIRKFKQLYDVTPRQYML